MRNPSEKPHSADKFFGKAFSSLQGFFDGFSTGAGLVKLPLWLKGLTPGLSAAPYVVGGGALMGALFVVKAVFDESENNKKEQLQLDKKTLLAQQLAAKIQETFLTLADKLAHDVDVANIRARAQADRKSQVEIEALVQKVMKEKTNKRYSHLLEEATPTKSKNKQLLKNILRDYVDSFGDEANRYRKASGKFPSQSKIEKLIQRVTGLNRYSPEFYDEVCALLSDDHLTQQRYRFMFRNHALKPPQSFIGQQVDRVRAFWKKQKTLRHIVVGVLGFIANASAGAGLTASTLKLFGVISSGAPVAWPILAVIAVGGLIYSGIAAALTLKRNKVRAGNLKSLSEEIKASEDKLELSRQLKKIHKNQHKLQAHKDTFDQRRVPDPTLKPVVQVKLPASTRIRMGFGLAAKLISGAADAMMLGLGIAWLITLAFPAIALLGPTLYIGGAFTGFSIFKSLKDEVKSIKHELATMQEVAEIRQHLMDKHRHKVGFQAELDKEPRLILKDVINDYVKYVNSLGADAQTHAKYNRQEKVLALIERMIGVKRPTDERGNLVHPLGDDAFYNHIAKFLKGKGENSAHANTIAQSLKTLLVKQPSIHAGLTLASVNADDPAVNKTQSIWSKGFDFLKKNALGIIFAVCVGCILPLFLAGPQVAIVLPVLAVVVGAYAIGKVVEHHSAKKVASLEAEKARYEMIERRHSVLAKTAVAPQPQAAEEVAHVDVPLPRMHHQMRERPAHTVVAGAERPQARLEVAAQPPAPEPSRARAESISAEMGRSMRKIWRPQPTVRDELDPLLRTPTAQEVPAT